MRHQRRFLLFLCAWSGVSMVNALMNAQPLYGGSMLPRTCALGILLVISGAIMTLQLPCSVNGAAGNPATTIGAYIYVALFATMGCPTVAVRLLAPNDGAAQEGLRFGASVSFTLGVLALLLVRTLGYLKQREPPPGPGAVAALPWRRADPAPATGVPPIAAQRRT